MISTCNRGESASRRAIAAAGAILILFAQLAGAVHYHESSIPSGQSATAQLAANEGICPVCQLAFHSPGSIAAVPAISSDAVASEPVAFAPSPEFDVPAFSPERVRAPPASPLA